MHYNRKIQDIITATAKAFGLDRRTMMSKNKYPEIAMPRMAAMYIAHKHGFTHSGIARQFNRTAGTVINAIKSVQNEADTRPKFAKTIKLIERTIENEQH